MFETNTMIMFYWQINTDHHIVNSYIICSHGIDIKQLTRVFLRLSLLKTASPEYDKIFIDLYWVGRAISRDQETGMGANWIKLINRWHDMAMIHLLWKMFFAARLHRITSFSAELLWNVRCDSIDNKFCSIILSSPVENCMKTYLMPGMRCPIVDIVLTV